MAIDPDIIEGAIEGQVDWKRTKYGSREVERHNPRDLSAVLDRTSEAIITPKRGIYLTKLISPGTG